MQTINISSAKLRKLELFIEENNGLAYHINAGPKEKVFLELLPYIRKFLAGIFPTRIHLEAIKNTFDGFDVTDDTYRLFLRKHLPVEYRRFLINKAFLRKYNRILEVIEAYKTRQEQYNALGFFVLKGHKPLEVTLDDFNYFLDNYIVKIEELVDRQLTEQVEYERKVIEAPGGVIIKEPAQVEPKTIENTIGNLEENRVPEKSADIALNSDIAASILGERVPGKINLLPGVTADHIPERFEIIDNKSKFPDEVKRWFDTDNVTFTEDIVVFWDRRLIHAADYDFKDNELIVCETAYDDNNQGYFLYRYYKGKLYFLENFVPHGINVSFMRQVKSTHGRKSTKDFMDFTFDEWGALQ